MRSTYVTYETTFRTVGFTAEEAISAATENFEERYDEDISRITLSKNDDAQRYEITINGDS